MPSRPVDVYAEGVLIKSGVTNVLKMVTPALPNGSFRYKFVIKDSRSSKAVPYELRGVEAGKTLRVDLRNIIS